MTPTTCLSPTYPTIPHIFRSPRCTHPCLFVTEQDCPEFIIIAVWLPHPNAKIRDTQGLVRSREFSTQRCVPPREFNRRRRPTGSTEFLLYDGRDPDCQRIWRNVVGDNCSCSGDRTLTHSDWRHQHRIATDFGIVLDCGLVLSHAVVIARNRAGP